MSPASLVTSCRFSFQLWINWYLSLITALLPESVGTVAGSRGVFTIACTSSRSCSVFRTLMRDLLCVAPAQSKVRAKLVGTGMNPLKPTIEDMGERPSEAPYQDGVRVVYLYCMAWPCWRLHTGSWQSREEPQERRPVSKGLEAFSQSQMQSSPCMGSCLSVVGTYEHMTP